MEPVRDTAQLLPWLPYLLIPTQKQNQNVVAKLMAQILMLLCSAQMLIHEYLLDQINTLAKHITANVQQKYLELKFSGWQQSVLLCV